MAVAGLFVDATTKTTMTMTTTTTMDLIRLPLVLSSPPHRHRVRRKKRSRKSFGKMHFPRLTRAGGKMHPPGLTRWCWGGAGNLRGRRMKAVVFVVVVGSVVAWTTTALMSRCRRSHCRCCVYVAVVGQRGTEHLLSFVTRANCDF